MIKELVHDPIFLAQKSDDATINDVQTAYDLIDTLEEHKEVCAGMAANMIGVKKRIVVFYDNDKPAVMFNPEIIKKSEPYRTVEGCLSLIGNKKQTLRYKNIKVRYQNIDFQLRIKSFIGFTAEVIQHEIDHCNGILI